MDHYLSLESLAFKRLPHDDGIVALVRLDDGFGDLSS